MLRISFPAPTILPSTLRFFSIPDSNTTTLVSTSSNPFLVAFDGTNFGYDPAVLQVTFGPVANRLLYSCLLHPATTATTVVCETQNAAQGTDLTFKVRVAGTSFVAIGTDTLAFPGPAPIISRIYGCSVTKGNGTAMCPTAGGIQLTLEGQRFNPPLTVLVNGELCVPLIYTVLGSVVSCTIPKGSFRRLNRVP